MLITIAPHAKPPNSGDRITWDILYCNFSRNSIPVTFKRTLALMKLLELKLYLKHLVHTLRAALVF